MTLEFGTDGVRGVAISEITPLDAVTLGAAAVDALGCSRLLIGRDPRLSGPILEASLAAGAAASGARVELLGVLPTPALAHLAQVEGVAAAMITASHNAFADNGVKVFAPGGTKLDDPAEERIEALLHGAEPAWRSGSDVGTIASVDGAIDRYVAHVVATFGAGTLAGTRVVLDCANGAMSAAAPSVLQQLGADVTVIHAEPDGRNINDRCGATDPSSLAAEIVRVGAHLGLAFDGDGDRVIAVDHTGSVVDGDRLIALSALDLRSRGELRADTVVVTVMTNLGFHRAMAAAGISVVTTPVGDRNVLIALEQGGFSLGGEQSGHLIYPALATTGDGLLAGLVLAELVGRSRSLPRRARRRGARRLSAGAPERPHRPPAGRGGDRRGVGCGDRRRRSRARRRRPGARARQRHRSARPGHGRGPHASPRRVHRHPPVRRSGHQVRPWRPGRSAARIGAAFTAR